MFINIDLLWKVSERRSREARMQRSLSMGLGRSCDKEICNGCILHRLFWENMLFSDVHAFLFLI